MKHRKFKPISSTARNAVVLAFALGVSSCPGKKEKENLPLHSLVSVAKAEPSTEQRALAAELRFPEQDSELSADSQRKLERLLDRAHRLGEVDEVKVISWASLEQGGEAHQGQEKLLADHRNESIREFLEKREKGVRAFPARFARHEQEPDSVVLVLVKNNGER